jgi:hypothetical protein
MTHAEQFALGEWLSDYPQDKTYAEIIDLLRDEDESVSPWQTVENFPTYEIVELIDSTRHHFQCTVETMKQEGAFA